MADIIFDRRSAETVSISSDASVLLLTGAYSTIKKADADGDLHTSEYPTVKNVAESKVKNTFAYAFNPGTLEKNYDITVEYGGIAVQPASISPDGDAGGESGEGTESGEERRKRKGTETMKLKLMTKLALAVAIACAALVGRAGKLYWSASDIKGSSANPLTGTGQYLAYLFATKIEPSGTSMAENSATTTMCS